MNTAEIITVYIADDHPLFRRGVREVIQERARFLLVGEAGNGETALKEIKTLRPRIAVLDVEMPGMNGIDVARALRDEVPETAVLMLTVHDEEPIFNRARDCGVMGYVLKDSASNDLQYALDMVVEGDCFVSPKVTALLMRRTHAAEQTLPPLASLTPAERDVLLRIAQGKSSRQIADELHNSPRTIGNHRLNICQKLNLHGALTLVRFAVENRQLIEEM